MKTERTTVIAKSLLALTVAVAVGLVLVPALGLAGASSKLNEQLIQAAKTDDPESVRSLLDKGASINT